MRKATRGRYPASSSRVNSGKKMAMGGSITATTHAAVRYTPSTSDSRSHHGAPPSRARSGSCADMSHRLSSSEGRLAPQMVSHSTAPNSSSITGTPPQPVSTRSSRRSRVWTSSGRRERQASAMADARRATAALSSPSSGGHVSSHGSRRAMSSTAVRRSSIPCPLRAVAVTTGASSPRDRASTSTATPLRRASSIRFTHTTSRGVRQRSCTARCRFRRRQVASATSTVTSAPPPQMKSRAICSSGESARRE